MNRIVTIDIAKAICIILVVIGHYIPDNAPEWYVTLRTFIYSFHMPLFMFASGFVYMATRKDISYGTFLGRKFRRLMIPYFSTSVIVITIKLLLQSKAYVENPVTLLSYAKILYSPEAGYFLWFIWALWWMFVIVPLCKQPAQRLGLLAVSMLLAYIPFDLTDIFCLQEFKRMFVYFMLGVVMAEHRDMIWRYAKQYSYAIYVMFAGAEAMLLTKVNSGGVKMLIPYLGIAAVLCISNEIGKHKERKIVRWLTMVSGSSYIVYLFHTTFEGFAKSVVHKIGMNGNVWFTVCAVCVIVVGLWFPILLHRYVLSRYNITRTLFGLK